MKQRGSAAFHLFPRFTPGMRLSAHPAFHRESNPDWWLSLHGLLSPLHRYYATAFTEIKAGYTSTGFPGQRFSGLQLPPRSRLTTFRQSYPWSLLGASSGPVSNHKSGLASCNGMWTFITTILTDPRTPRTGRGNAFRQILTYRPVHSEVRQCWTHHSHHEAPTPGI